MRIGSLFSGIGGLELGLERAGVGQTVWQCECDDYALAVLAKHWPHAQRFRDVRAMDESTPPVDVICGGFPCQDISNAGRREGITGERSGLFFELMRVVRMVRPRFVVLENVAALLGRGLDTVLGELSESGFDAEWSIVSACSVGASHVRERLFVVAYTNSVYGRARIGDSVSSQSDRTISSINGRQSSRLGSEAWLEDPSALYGGANGVPRGMDRNRCLGNAVVPACAEIVGRRLLEIDNAMRYHHA